MVDMILSNTTAGLDDFEMNQTQKIIGEFASHIFYQIILFMDFMALGQTL